MISDATGLVNDFDYYTWQVMHWNGECIDDVFEWFHAAEALISSAEESLQLRDAYIKMPGIPQDPEEYQNLCDIHDFVVAIDKHGGIWRIVDNRCHDVWHPGDPL